MVARELFNQEDGTMDHAGDTRNLVGGSAD